MINGELPGTFAPTAKALPRLDHFDVALKRSPFRRLVPSIYRRLGALLYGEKLLARRYGCTFLLDQSNLIDRSMLYRFGWEGELYSRLIEFWRPHAADGRPTTFLDIGAHWGLYAIRATGEPGIGPVFAFEPDPRNIAQLAANLYLNDLVDRVALVPHAVTDSDGELVLGLAPGRNRGVSRIAEEGFAGEAIAVACERLDSRFGGTGGRFLVKMDVEGAELQALRGMERLIRSNEVILMVETNSGFAAVRDFLAGCGLMHVAMLRNEQDEEDHLFASG
jgi:FkbM family methyltransferase